MKYAIRINNNFVIGKHYEAIPISCINNTDEIMLFDFDEKDKAQAVVNYFAKTLTSQPVPLPWFDFVSVNNLDIKQQ